MDNKALEKWFSRDIKETMTLSFPDIGIELELEGLDWKRQRNILKKNTIPQKGGGEVRNQDGYLMDLVAASIKKANGEPFNLYDNDLLKRIGVKTHEEAINKLFKVAEIGRIVDAAQKLAGDTDEEEKEEIDELKNSSEATI